MARLTRLGCRTVIIPASGLKSATRIAVSSEYRQPVSNAPRTRLRNPGSQAVDEANAFGLRQIAHACSLDRLKRLYPTPSVIARDVACLPGVI